jgi:murein DD-endopeptidase MepM/ murein hydrolase activator NlpD
VKLNKRNKIIISSILLTPLLVLSVIFFPTHLFKKSATNLTETNLKGDSFFDLEFQYDAPEIKYGFVVNDYNTTEDIFKKNEFLSDVLMRHNVQYSTIDKLVKKAADVFDVRKMRVGKNYMVVGPKGTNQAAQYFIYEPSPFRYIIYDLQNETNVSVVERPIDTLRQEASGIIYSNLWNAMMDNELSYELAVKMEDALGYSVDFHHIQDNDKFKLIYDQLYIEGEPVGIGQLKAAFFEHQKKPYYAYHYEDDAYSGFFDDEGRPMKKAFLKSPVKYTRISSPFNLRRFHPVLRRVKAHLGTDYAAPRGTPIYAVANGVVSRSGRTRGNGNFVKIKHDGVYSSQYLHMNKIASTAKKGMRVKQGDVIGYVGSTGLATGPHVCFRFWKNGKQVDHRKENLPAPEPMSEEHLAIFKGLNKDLRTELDLITYKTEQEIAAAKNENSTVTKKTIP